tara:strand:+ start:384 stop:737 length:354 start_codon:yes stop_codon:yes gene_type:complete
MAARSTGVFPREGFNLDSEAEITASAVAANTTLANAKTIRVIAVNAGSIDDAGTNKITVTLGGQDVVFNLADLDRNGVGIAHIRGALCDADNNVQYVLGGTATVSGVFYELVDGPRR